MNKTSLWSLLTLTLFIFIPLLTLLQNKMSGDGTLYASIAWNMAHNIGSLWHPVYTATVFPAFYEHPPLGMFVMSLFFRIFGDYFLVDRLYCFMTWLLSLLGMMLLWYQLQPNVSKQLWFLPVLCWIVIPLTTATYCANAIESLLVVLTTFASWTVLRAIQNSKKLSFFWIFCSALLITGAFFSNGLQAFFPLTIPVIYRITFQKPSYTLTFFYTITLLIITAIILGAVLSYPPAREFTQHYWQQQVFATLSGHRTGNGNYNGFKHLFGIFIIFLQWLPLLFITGVTLFVAKTKLSINRNIIFLFCVGLSASLPILISSRQESHYFLQAFPFLILICIEILTPMAEKFIHKPASQSPHDRFILFTLITLFFSACISGAALYGREPEALQDVNAISKIVPNGSMISVSSQLWNDWNLHAYFYRYHRISLTQSVKEPYFLSSINEENHPKQYTYVNIPLKTINFYRDNSTSAFTAPG